MQGKFVDLPVIAELNQEYWNGFSDNFLARLKSLEWVPFQVVKIFKIGAHWVMVYRPSLSASNVQYWVGMTWQWALNLANEVAATIRKEFESLYSRTN